MLRALDLAEDADEISARTRAAMARCRASTGDDFLTMLSTPVAAQDMDWVRQARGEQKINYLGASQYDRGSPS